MSSSRTNKTIWIDLDNSPHVPFFAPIIRELQNRRCSVFLTARDTFQVIGLAEYYGFSYAKVGRHYGANKILKVLGTVWRTLQLVPIIVKLRPDLSVSHGSRPLILLSAVLRIPTIHLFDYEHTTSLPFLRPELGIAPEVINTDALKARFKHGIRKYHGIKEDVYIESFRPNQSILNQLGLQESDIAVTIRPPANEAHYHNPQSDKLFLKVVEFLGANARVRMIILPRNEKTQKDLVYKTWPEWCKEGRIIIPDRVIDGLNLIWHSDLVISGGGTMNREAAALGVPVYSIFRGTLGAVDKYLADHGRLIMIEKVEDVNLKIRLVKRQKDFQKSFGDRLALKQIKEAIVDMVDGREAIGKVGPSRESKSSQQCL